MSSTMSRESIIEILEAEKDDTRLWLRAEMDRLVDPMLDSIFNRLKTKLTNQIERTHSGGSDCELMNLNFESNQSVNFIPQPSTYLSSPNPTSFHLNPQYINPQFTLPTSPVPSQTMSNTQNFNELTNIESQIPIPIKQDGMIESTVSNEPILVSGQSLPESIVNDDQSNQNLLVNWNIEEDDEEEEECDCDDCVNGGIEFKEEDDEIDNDVQWIKNDDDQENEHQESSRPVKRARLDSPQPHNVQQLTPRQVTYESQQQQPNQVNNKRFITVHLQCAHCPNTFPEDQLNPHMLNEHSIGLFRCVVKDCGQSFHSSRNLSEHINQTHHSTTQWHCNKCPKHFSKYQQLSEHNTQYHLLGHFQCSFPSCSFTGEYRSKMHGHYKRHHRRVLKCQHCDYDTHDATNMAQHQHAHLGIKPYRCKWPTCDYSSAYKQDTLKHIRVHLSSSAQNRNQSMDHSVDPKDYLEVASELL